MDDLPHRVLYLNHSTKWSEAEFTRWWMLDASERRRVEPIVVFGEGPAADLMREIGVETHVLPLAGNVRAVRKGTLGDAADFAAALLRLLDAPATARRLGHNGYEHIRASFRARDEAQRVADVYHAIFGSGFDALDATAKLKPRCARKGNIAARHSL